MKLPPKKSTREKLRAVGKDFEAADAAAPTRRKVSRSTGRPNVKATGQLVDQYADGPGRPLARGEKFRPGRMLADGTRRGRGIVRLVAGYLDVEQATALERFAFENKRTVGSILGEALALAGIGTYSEGAET